MMNPTDYANYLYSACHSAPSGNYARTAEEKETRDTLGREDFAASLLKTREERGDSGGGADKEECDVIGLVLDSDSSLYEEMYTRMKLQLEQSEEEKKKQAIIDALDAILQSLSAKKDEYWRKTPDSVSSMAELSQVIDSLDKDDPRKEELNLLRLQLQNLGIYIDLDVGVKGRDQSSWGTTLTQQLIREEAKETEPSIFDII